jgi:hypothetical protein
MQKMRLFLPPTGTFARTSLVPIRSNGGEEAVVVVMQVQGIYGHTRPEWVCVK